MDRSLSTYLATMRHLLASGMVPQPTYSQVQTLVVALEPLNNAALLLAEVYEPLQTIMASLRLRETEERFMDTGKLTALMSAWQRLVGLSDIVFAATNTSSVKALELDSSLQTVFATIPPGLLNGCGPLHHDDIHQEISRIRQQQAQMMMQLQEIQRVLEDWGLLNSLSGKVQGMTLADVF